MYTQVNQVFKYMSLRGSFLYKPSHWSFITYLIIFFVHVKCVLWRHFNISTRYTFFKNSYKESHTECFLIKWNDTWELLQVFETKLRELMELLLKYGLKVYSITITWKYSEIQILSLIQSSLTLYFSLQAILMHNQF